MYTERQPTPEYHTPYKMFFVWLRPSRTHPPRHYAPRTQFSTCITRAVVISDSTITLPKATAGQYRSALSLYSRLNCSDVNIGYKRNSNRFFTHILYLLSHLRVFSRECGTTAWRGVVISRIPPLPSPLVQIILDGTIFPIGVGSGTSSKYRDEKIR